MADWIETVSGDLINLDKAHVLGVDAQGSDWLVLAWFGSKRYTLSRHRTQKDAREAALVLALGEIEADIR